uniref:Uncharacterized protein n=1 Tax=CrAss-like virus sp. ctYsL76 TaxID=2826826 RepID=A0A8S5QMF8_9CAUD|nr:MAG TPA: hypothetical protein [CrAss-like virus sp. ctYsL76]
MVIPCFNISLLLISQDELKVPLFVLNLPPVQYVFDKKLITAKDRTVLLLHGIVSKTLF